MARGAQQQAQQTFNQSQGVFGNANSNAQQIYGQLLPALTQEATNPQGYSPKDLSAINTAGQQSVGGATAGAVGEGNLAAARTRNSGGFAPAMDEAVRSGERQLSSDALQTQTNNANLKEAQRQEGLSGLGSLYGTNTGNALSALGLGNQATQTGVQAGQSGWLQNFFGLLKALNPNGNFGGGQPASFGIGA